MHTKILLLPWPDTKTKRPGIYPIFIPFAGCPRRCIFCAQHVQSGTAPCADSQNTEQLLQEAEHHLLARQEQGLPALEVAFYGGTFTALPQKDLSLSLNLTQKLLARGAITGARCSTRPDAITATALTSLKEAGFTTIELGVQSFNTFALNLAQRHYTEECVLQACAAVREAGFTLGVQLMPGMPGVSESIFLDDTQKALAQGADFLRFYPCQVIAGTELEELWRSDRFIPWTLSQSIETLSRAWLAAHLCHVPVIRMGLAPQPELASHILAGPRHDALGNLVQSEALYHYICKKLSDYTKASFADTPARVQKISLPKSCQGYFWGHEQNLAPKWHSLGFFKEHIFWHSEQNIEIVL